MFIRYRDATAEIFERVCITPLLYWRSTLMAMPRCTEAPAAKREGVRQCSSAAESLGPIETETTHGEVCHHRERIMECLAALPARPFAMRHNDALATLAYHRPSSRVASGQIATTIAPPNA